MDIKETKELFKALGVLAGVAGAVYKDKKIGVDDLQHLMGAALNFSVLKDGFEGLGVAKDEIGDLDKAEILELMSALYDALDEYEKNRKA